jgi:hypothetical protein
MFFMIRFKYPMIKQSEVTAAWNKQPKPEPYVKNLGTFARMDLDNSVESYTIQEVQNDKISEWYQAIGKSLAPYGRVEGLKIQIDVVSKSGAPTGK